MVRMVIVDDEPLIRQGLESLDWNSIGVQVVGVVSNGLDALALIKKHQLQLLFTDIKMPGIDGLQLIEMAQQLCPGIKSVLLTGYGDFETARKAIQLSVVDYILKPCDTRNVLDVIGRAALLVRTEHERRAREVELLAECCMQRKLQFEDCLRSYMAASPVVAPDDARMRMVDGQQMVAVLVLCPAHGQWEGLPAGIIKGIIRACPAQLLNEPWSVQIDGDMTALIFHEESSPDHTLEDEVAQLCYRALKDFSGGTPHKLGVSKQFVGVQALREGYLQAQKCLSLLFSQTDIYCYRYANFEAYISEPDVPTALVQSILMNFEERNYLGVETAVDSLGEYYRRRPVEECFIKYVIIDVCRSSQHILAQRTQDAMGLLRTDTYLEISAASDLNELITYTKHFLQGNIDRMLAQKDLSGSQLYQQIQTFIKARYRENVNLTDLAQSVHLNADYLGRLIRKQYQATFSQLLLAARLEKACALLGETMLPIADIAEAVGIGDTRYFSQLFKNKYEMTPSEYRRSISTKDSGAQKELRRCRPLRRFFPGSGKEGQA